MNICCFVRCQLSVECTRRLVSGLLNRLFDNSLCCIKYALRFYCDNVCIAKFMSSLKGLYFESKWLRKKLIKALFLSVYLNYSFRFSDILSSSLLPSLFELEMWKRFTLTL